MALLGPDFFARATVDVARDLLGATLRVRDEAGAWAGGRIVETEAYGGEDDPASHAGRGPTPRSAIMFGPPGVAYVYLVYGVHHCLNFVTGPAGQAGAVLVRALEPTIGRPLMARRRGLDPQDHRPRDLTAGPGRLCRALGVDLAWNGLTVATRESADGLRLLLVEGATAPVPHRAGPRVGITRAVARPHRFCVPGSGCLSR